MLNLFVDILFSIKLMKIVKYVQDNILFFDNGDIFFRKSHFVEKCLKCKIKIEKSEPVIWQHKPLFRKHNPPGNLCWNCIPSRLKIQIENCVILDKLKQ